jgi:hypothetical protein
MVKKSKLSSVADEIAKLERAVKRRSNQLNKMGVELDRPTIKKPKTMKQAKDMIFKMESFLRHTSTNVNIRKGAERGTKIKKEKEEIKQMDRDYKTAKKVMKKASNYFMKEIANPINEKRKEKGMLPRSFKDELSEFTLGMNPKNIKDKEYQKHSAKRMMELALKYKNNPAEAHKELVNEGNVTLRLNILHSLANVTSANDYKKLAEYFNSMSDAELLDHYKANKSLYNSVMFDSDNILSDYELSEYADSVKEALDISWEDEE